MSRPGWVTLATLGSVIAVGLIDYLTPTDVEFSLFYLLPVVAAAWWAGRRPAVAVAIVAVIAEFAADTLQRRATPAAAVWNNGTRAAIFFAVAVGVDLLRRERSRRAARDAERDAFLALLDREFPRPIATLRALSRRLHAARLELPEELRTLSTAFAYQIDDLDFLATDLLTIGNLQAGRMTFARKPFDLRAIVRAAVVAAPERDRLVLAGGSDEILVEGDEARARHAIESAIGRALDAGSRDDVRLLVRSSASEGVVEIAARGAVSTSELTLARLLVEGQGGTLRRRQADGRTVTVLGLPSVSSAFPPPLGDGPEPAAAVTPNPGRAGPG